MWKRCPGVRKNFLLGQTDKNAKKLHEIIQYATVSIATVLKL